MTSNHHALYDLGYTRTTMALNKEKQDREVEQNSETTSQFGLQAATRLHEVGIASNRGSACHGEYVPGPCTHRLNKQPVIDGSQLDRMPHVHHDHFIDSAPDTNWHSCIEHGVKIGLGSDQYELIEI